MYTIKGAEEDDFLQGFARFLLRVQKISATLYYNICKSNFTSYWFIGFSIFMRELMHVRYDQRGV